MPKHLKKSISGSSLLGIYQHVKATCFAICAPIIVVPEGSPIRTFSLCRCTWVVAVSCGPAASTACNIDLPWCTEEIRSPLMQDRDWIQLVAWPLSPFRSSRFFRTTGGSRTAWTVPAFSERLVASLWIARLICTSWHDGIVTIDVDQWRDVWSRRWPYFHINHCFWAHTGNFDVWILKERLCCMPPCSLYMTLDRPPAYCTSIEDPVQKLVPVSSSQEMLDHGSIGAVEPWTMDCEARDIISEGEVTRDTWRPTFNGFRSRKSVQCKPSVRESPKKTS